MLRRSENCTERDVAVELDVSANVSGKTNPCSIIPVEDKVMSRKVMVMSSEDEGGYETTMKRALSASSPSSIVGVDNEREMGLQQSVFDIGMTAIDCDTMSLFLVATPCVEMVKHQIL